MQIKAFSRVLNYSMNWWISPGSLCPGVNGAAAPTPSWRHSACLCVTGPQLTGVTGWRRQLCCSGHTQVSPLSLHEVTGLRPHSTAVMWAGWAELLAAPLLLNLTSVRLPPHPASLYPPRAGRRMLQQQQQQCGGVCTSTILIMWLKSDLKWLVLLLKCWSSVHVQRRFLCITVHHIKQ